MVISDGATEDLSKIFLMNNTWKNMNDSDEPNYDGADRFETGSNRPAFTSPPVYLID